MDLGTSLDTELIRDIILYRVNMAYGFGQYDIDIETISMKMDGYHGEFYYVSFKYWECFSSIKKEIVVDDSMNIYKDEYISLLRQKKLKDLGI